MSDIGAARARSRSQRPEYCLSAKDGRARTSRCGATRVRWSFPTDRTIRSPRGCLTAARPAGPSSAVTVEVCTGVAAQRWERVGRQLRSGGFCLRQDDRALRQPRLRMGTCAFPDPEVSWTWG